MTEKQTISGCRIICSHFGLCVLPNTNEAHTDTHTQRQRCNAHTQHRMGAENSLV